MLEFNRELTGLDTLKDLPMKMRLLKGVWYSAFKYKGQFIGRCLKASEKQVRLAERDLSALIEQLERGESEKQKAPGFLVLVANFERVVLSGKAPAYRVRAGSCIRHLKSHFERFVLPDINKDTIVHYRRFREATGAKGSTIRKELYVLKMIVNLEDERFKLPSFKRPDMQFNNKSKKITRRLTYDEALRVIQSADVWLKPIVTVGLFTGLRLSNVLGLKWSCVDLAAKTVWVKDTKNGEDVTVPMSGLVFNALQYLRGFAVPGVDLVFPHLDKHLFERKVQKACKRAHESAGLDWLRPFHDYRHFFCNFLINEGKADYVLVSKLAGHKSPAMTQNYSSPSLGLKQDAVSSFDRQKDQFAELLKGIISALGAGVKV